MSVGAARPAARIPAIRATVAELPVVPLAVAGITVAACILHLTQIHQSLFGDEVWTYQDVTGRSLAALVRHVHTGLENSPPLFFVLAWLSAKLGDPTVLIRLPSLILGAATIPVVYLLGRETVGRVPGLIGAAVFAASPFANYYGIEARPYATMTFFVALSTWALVKAVRSGSWRWWLVYALATAGAAYSHYTSIFVLATQAAWALWMCRGRLREPLLANALLVLLYAPWLPHVRGKELVIGLLYSLTLHHVLQDVARFVVGYPYAPLHQIPTRPGLAVIAAAALLGGFGLAQQYLADRGRALRRLPSGHQVLIPVLALATPVGVLLYSLLGPDIWDSRSLYASAPAAALVLGALLVAIPRRPRALAIPVVLGILVFGTIRAISPSWARPPYRVAARYLDRVAMPRDPIVMASWALNLDQALPPEFTRPHVVVKGALRQWPNPPPGGSVYAVVDDAVLRALKIDAPNPPGLELVGRRNYSGLVDFSVLRYRPLRPAASRTR